MTLADIPLIGPNEDQSTNCDWFRNAIISKYEEYYTLKINIPIELIIHIHLDFVVIEIQSKIFPQIWEDSKFIGNQMSKFNKYAIWTDGKYNYKFEQAENNCILYFPESMLSESILKRYFYIFSFIHDVYWKDLEHGIDSTYLNL